MRQRRVLVFLGVILLMGCNLPVGATVSPAGVEISTVALVATTEAPLIGGETPAPQGATPGPTPTMVPADACPPFVYDSLAATLSSSIDPADFIGKHYDSLAYTDAVDGYQSEMLDDVHAWEDLHTRTLHYEFLERMVCRDASGSAYFEVKDAQILNLAVDQSITRTCWIGETPVPTALAIGKMDLTQPLVIYGGMTGWRFRVDQAWRFDLDRETITSLPLDGLVCIQPNEGGD